MRKAIPVAAVVILLSGCSGGASSGTASPSDVPRSVPSMAASPSTSASTSASTPASPSMPDGADWSLRSSGLERAGAQVVFDAAADGERVVASVLTEGTSSDFDAAIVFSGDSGETWTWGGSVADQGRTFPEGVLLESDQAIIVGSNQVDGAGGVSSKAFMAVATAPAFVPTAIDLPAQFDGTGVQLQDIVSVDGEWVIAGYSTGKPDDKGKVHPAGALWRSADKGATWTKQALDVPGAQDVVVKALVVAPDGSWNVVGQVSSGDLIRQYDVLWLRSTDQGRTFSQMSKETLTADFDQGATEIAFSPDGSTAILGWTEVTEDHGSDSALWVEAAGHDLSQIGTGGVPVEGSNPSGQFVDGILWNGPGLVAWGSTDGSYPMPDAQFWTLTGAKLVPTAVLPGNGTPLDVTTVLTLDGSMLALGFTGADVNQADVGIWKAPFTGA